MTELLGGVTALIVDKDLGFAFWLGEIFIEAGCPAVPALDCQQAVSVTTELNLKCGGRESELIGGLRYDMHVAKFKLEPQNHCHPGQACSGHSYDAAILQRPSGRERGMKHP